MKLISILQDFLLHEGLIHSTDADTTAGMLNKWSASNVKFTATGRPNNDIIIQFTDKITKQELDNLLKVINAFGWFVAASTFSIFSWTKYNYDAVIKKLESGSKLLGLSIEPKYDLELNKYELSNLYHVSPQTNREKIAKIGLVPKGKGKLAYHPERIYLTKDKNDAIFLAGKFANFHSGLYDLYQIDIDKLRHKNKDIRFFKDPAFTNKGLYTLSNIPPDCITLIDTI